MPTFKDILNRAEKRKGGQAQLNAMLIPHLSENLLRQKTSNECLALMTRGIFQAGFVWKIIENKWPDFETVFYKFNPKKVLNIHDEEWDKIAEDKRIVRNVPKIRTVRENAEFILDLERNEKKTFAQFIADWPNEDLVGLWEFLKKNGSRLGGMTGQYFLRRLGKDSFMLSRDVVLSLQDIGLDIKDQPTSKREFKLIQRYFNEVHEETALSLTHISKILGYASGENYPVETIVSETRRFEDVR